MHDAITTMYAVYGRCNLHASLFVCKIWILQAEPAELAKSGANGHSQSSGGLDDAQHISSQSDPQSHSLSTI